MSSNADNEFKHSSTTEVDSEVNYKLLSIDIGVHNLAIAIFSNGKFGSFQLADIDKFRSKNEDLVIYRCKALTEILNILKPTTIIVEKQFTSNVKAMSIMYAIVMYSITSKLDVKLIDPKMKFKYWDIPINTHNKEHKKESVARCEKYLVEINSSFLNDFRNLKKKDDVADAINQGIAYLKFIETLPSSIH